MKRTLNTTINRSKSEKGDNITRYLDANGNTVAQYTYDAFGGTLSQSGSLASFFRHRFSTKYLDVETGLYYYGYRFYLPPLMRWLSRDPIGERGGLSLYAFCENDALESFDSFGENRYITQFDILNLGGSGGTQMHVGVAVDDWVCRNGKWVKMGVVTFDFGPEPRPRGSGGGFSGVFRLFRLLRSFVVS